MKFIKLSFPFLYFNSISRIPTPITCILIAIPRIPTPILCIPTLIPCILTQISHILTQISHIPTPIPCIPILSLCIPTPIPHIPLIPFSCSLFRILQIALKLRWTELKNELKDCQFLNGLQLKNDKKSNLRTSKLNKDLSQIECFQYYLSIENLNSVFYFET